MKGINTAEVNQGIMFSCRSCVRVVSSSRAGMGKTLFVTRMMEKLHAVMPRHRPLVSIPVHGPVVTGDSIMQYLIHHKNELESTILHFDISPSVSWPTTYVYSILLPPTPFSGAGANGHYSVLTAHPRRPV